MKIDEKVVADYMKKYDCSREDAISVIMDDFEVDKMSVKEAESDMSAEQKKATKDARKTGTRSYKFTKRERKVDDEKVDIIAKIADFLTEIDGFSVEIVKNEREIALKVGENDYSINLVKHRPPKKS